MNDGWEWSGWRHDQKRSIWHGVWEKQVGRLKLSKSVELTDMQIEMADIDLMGAMKAETLRTAKEQERAACW